MSSKLEPVIWLRVLVTLSYMTGRTGVRTYVRTDVHDVMAIKPNFLTSMGYHIFLTMVLRARAELRYETDRRNLLRSYSRKIIAITVLNCYVLKYMKIFPDKENRKVQSKLSLLYSAFILRLCSLALLIHRCVSLVLSGFVILWRLFLKPTRLNSKIETQAAQWYCSSPSSATASIPASPRTD